MMGRRRGRRSKDVVRRGRMEGRKRGMGVRCERGKEVGRKVRMLWMLRMMNREVGGEMRMVRLLGSLKSVVVVNWFFCGFCGTLFLREIKRFLRSAICFFWWIERKKEK